MLPRGEEDGSRANGGLNAVTNVFRFTLDLPCTILCPRGLNSRAFSEVSEVGLGGVFQRDWLS